MKARGPGVASPKPGPGARAAVFLDRDGVLNDVVFRDGQPGSPRTVDEFQVSGGVAEALAGLTRARFPLLVVSNQPDVARGLLDRAALDEMTRRLLERLPIDGVFVCPHDDGDACSCRKPKPGLLEQAAAASAIDLSRSFIIGDSWKDVEAGRRAGCTTILVRREYNRDVPADHVCHDLESAVDFILRSHMDPDASYVERYLEEARLILSLVSASDIERLIQELVALRARGGRLFVLGVGGSAANASHAVNDFRKVAGIEAYAPTDNVSELTARINDEGWESAYAAWLAGSRLVAGDAVLVLSVGGGSLEPRLSGNLVTAVDYARSVGATVLGILGRDGGYTAGVAAARVVVPTVNAEHVTPHTEAFQSVVLHLLVSAPALRLHPTTWESVTAAAGGARPGGGPVVEASQ
jgi:D-sedoheptulose 7-phosphate isomerase